MKTLDYINKFGIKDFLKISLISSIGFYFPLFILGAILSFFGYDTVTLNDSEVTGFKSLIVYIIAAPISISIFAMIHFCILSIGFFIMKFILKLFVRK